MTHRTADGMVVSSHSDGLVTAVGLSGTPMVFHIPEHEVIAIYTAAYAGVAAVFEPRWRAYTGPNLDEDEFTEAMQSVVMTWLSYYRHQRKLDHPFWKGRSGRRNLGLLSTRGDVREVITRRFPRGTPGYDELCAALFGETVAEFRRWDANYEQYLNN